MYTIRSSSVVPESIDLPKCMYHIKPLNGMQNGLGVLSSKQIKMEPELQAINDKQLEVISKLRKLRDTVDSLIKNAGNQSCQPTTQTKGKAASGPAVGRVCSKSSVTVLSANAPSELVIEADPIRPPLSLLFFRSLQPSIRTVSHTHSSCKEQVNSKLTSLFTQDVTDANSTVRVVWKNTENKSSRLTPTTLGSCGIEGEPSVARYLSRIFSQQSGNKLNYDALTDEELVLVDGVLELSECVDSDPEQFLRSLQAYIQKQGRSPRTIADFVGYSTLQYLTKKQQSKPLSKPLIDWMNCLTNEMPF